MNMHPEFHPMSGQQFLIMVVMYLLITFIAIRFSGASKFLFTKQPDRDINEEPQEAKF